MTHDDLKSAFPHCKILSEEPPKILINPKKLIRVTVLDEKITDDYFGIMITINSKHEKAIQHNKRRAMSYISWGADSDGTVNSLILHTLRNYCSACGIEEFDCDFNDVADIASNTVADAENMRK